MRAATVLLLAASPVMVQAQQPTLEPGRRIRVTYDCRTPALSVREDCRRDEGTLVAWGDDRLVLKGRDSTTVAVEMGWIRQVEIQTGRRSHWLSGAGVGFLLGAVGASFLTHDLCTEGSITWSPGGCMGKAAVMGGAVGALLGVVPGLAIKTDVWREVPIGDQRVGITPVLTPRAVGLGLRF